MKGEIRGDGLLYLTPENPDENDFLIKAWRNNTMRIVTMSHRTVMTLSNHSLNQTREEDNLSQE
jgi:hypothetical protein